MSRNESSACEPCKKKKCKCDRRRPYCSQCNSAPSLCNYGENNKRGIPSGYINALEQRLNETEVALYNALSEIQVLKTGGHYVAQMPDTAGISSRPANVNKMSRMAEWRKYSLKDVESIQQWRRSITNDSGLGQSILGQTDKTFSASPADPDPPVQTSKPHSNRLGSITDLTHRSLTSNFQVEDAPPYGRDDDGSQISRGFSSFEYHGRMAEGLSDSFMNRADIVLDDGELGNREARDTGIFQQQISSWAMSPASQSQAPEQSPATIGDQQLPQSERLAQEMHHVYY